MKSLLILIALIVVCTGTSPPKPTPPKPDSRRSDSSDDDTRRDSRSAPPTKPPVLPKPPIKPPVLPPPPNNCSAICNKIYAPVCSGPVYGCGELHQSGNICEFNYFNCINLIKTNIPYEVKYKGPCYGPIAIP